MVDDGTPKVQDFDPQSDPIIPQFFQINFVVSRKTSTVAGGTGRVHPAIEPEEQIFMAAVFLDHPIFEYCNFVSHAHSGETMA